MNKCITILNNPDIKFKQQVVYQVKQLSNLINKYFSGKLDDNQEKIIIIKNLIKNLNFYDQMEFYYHFISCIQTWKILWYFSPLFRQSPKLFISISHISFPNLTRLVINQSSIHSIQPISWLSCPSLKEIDIQQNYIVSLKPLHKTRFKQMTVLKFYYNNFNHDQQQWISRTKWNNFHPLGLYHFCKEMFYQGYFKVQANELNKIFVEKSKGESINNQRVISKLKDKFIIKQFYVHFSKV